MSTIAEKQAVLIEEFEFFDEWMDKYNHIIEMGKAMPVLDAVDKNDDLLVQGCQSKVWLKAEKKKAKTFVFLPMPTPLLQKVSLQC